MENNKQLPNLGLCLLLDAIGMLSFTVPFIGEFSDVIWAPVSGFIYMRLFGGRMGMYGGLFSFIEEALPGLDIIPTFTITYFMRKKELAKNKVKPEVIILK